MGTRLCEEVPDADGQIISDGTEIAKVSSLPAATAPRGRLRDGPDRGPDRAAGGLLSGRPSERRFESI